MMAKLTTRQRQIAALLAAGLTQRQIAHRLGIAEQTCYNTTQAMRDRTGTTTAVIAVKAAAETERSG